MSEIAVQLENCSRLFGKVRAADRVSLTIRQNEFFTILGASGSGKTTTLRMIAGFEEPDEGRVLIAGQDVTKLPAYKRDVHTVFQDYALFPHLTVRENVAFPLEVKGLPVGKLVDDALALVQLAALGDRKPTQLSGGQQQRVALRVRLSTIHRYYYSTNHSLRLTPKFAPNFGWNSNGSNARPASHSSTSHTIRRKR